MVIQEGRIGEEPTQSPLFGIGDQCYFKLKNIQEEGGVKKLQLFIF